MKAYYYMVSLGQPYNHCKYFKAKSKKQIAKYCNDNNMKVVNIFDPYDTETDGITYTDVTKILA